MFSPSVLVHNACVSLSNGSPMALPLLGRHMLRVVTKGLVKLRILLFPYSHVEHFVVDRDSRSEYVSVRAYMWHTHHKRDLFSLPGAISS